MTKKNRKYSLAVITATKEAVNREVIKAIETSPEIKKEMDRIFQKANRRIQNIEKGGYISPAVLALGDRGDKYTKFTRQGKTFTEQKREYYKAVEFLKKPTSTATGAKQFENQMRKDLGISKEAWKVTGKALAQGYNSFKSGLMGYIPYQQVVQQTIDRVAEQGAIDYRNAQTKGEQKFIENKDNLNNHIMTNWEEYIEDVLTHYSKKIGKILD